MHVSYTWNYGMAVGILIAEPDEDDGIDWGVAILLGPLTLIIEKPTEEYKESPLRRKSGGLFVVSI